MPYLKQTQNTDNFLEVLVRDHKRYMPIMQFLDNLTLQDSELTWKERELISLETSKTNGAEFCVGIHNGLLKALDDRKDEIRHQKMDPILQFVRKLAKDSSTITREDIAGITAAGWNDQTVEDVIGLVGAITVYDVLANGFGFKSSLPEHVFEEMGKGTVKEGGFVAQFQSFIPSK